MKFIFFRLFLVAGGMGLLFFPLGICSEMLLEKTTPVGEMSLAARDHEEEKIGESSEERKFMPGGTFQADGGLFYEDRTPLDSGVEIRRARLSGSGVLGTDWEYEAELEFADAVVTPTDIWLSYAGFGPFTLKLGHQREPFSLSSMMGTESQLFQERASNDALLMRRNLGLVLGVHGTHWTANGGVFGEGLTLTRSHGVSGRLTYAPLVENRQVLHLGLGGKWRTPGRGGILRFGAEEEADATRVDLADTGPISEVVDFAQFGAEFSILRGPFSVDGEYIHTAIRREEGFGKPHFDGWYVQASYFLTDDFRAYDSEKGYYEMLIPKRSIGQGGWGAWEVAVRYSGLDLESQGIEGGAQNSVTVGINGWLNQSVLLRVNYVHTRSRPTSRLVQPAGVEENTHALTVRIQLIF